MIRTIVLALSISSSAAAQDAPMRAQEQICLDAYHASAGKAILEALSAGSLGDIDQLQTVLSGDAISPLATTLSGDWACRTFKLGGLSPLTVYAQFQCKFTPDGTAFDFEKLTGSQRTIGRITMQDGAMVYLGVGYVADVAIMTYADLPPEEFGNGEYQPQVGLVEQTGPNTARILFPAPVTESGFDILYLTREPSVDLTEPTDSIVD